MIVTLSIARLLSVFSQVEGRDISPEEMEDRGGYFGLRLRAHLSEAYSLLMNGIVYNSGSIISYHVDLQTNDATKINQGLALLNPVSVTVEPSDIDALVAIPMYRAVLHENWNAIAEQLQKMPAAEWFDRFNAVGTKLVLTPPDRPISSSGVDNSDFVQWCVQNNIPIPRAGAMAERQLRAAKEAEQKRAADSARWSASDRETDFFIREIPAAE